VTRVAVAVIGFILACNWVAAAQVRRSTADASAEQGWTAVQERRFGDALDLFVVASGADPSNPSLAAGAGLAAFMLGRDDEARTWLERALKLAPGYADASLLLGEVLYRGGRLQDAIAVYEGARKHNPDTLVFGEKIDQWSREVERQRGLYESRGTHFSVKFEGPADEMLARRAVELLESAYWRVGAALTVYPGQPITTLLYTTERFRDVTRSPEWAAAAYDGRIHIPTQGALERPGELERVLTHEFVHALVATLGGRNVPVWLNEGLATIFESRELSGDRALAASGDGRPPSLTQLEGSFSRLSAADAQTAYSLSGRAVQKMLQLRGAPAIVMLLQDVGRGVPFASAFHQRIAMRYDDFQLMVARE
jgi:tetratricopeptide (TPR) repeat protein